MKLDGTFTFTGPRQAVWDLLQDPEVLARALPGTERLEATGPDQYKGVMKVSVGPVTAAKFDVSVTLTCAYEASCGRLTVRVVNVADSVEAFTPPK